MIKSRLEDYLTFLLSGCKRKEIIWFFLKKFGFFHLQICR